MLIAYTEKVDLVGSAKPSRAVCLLQWGEVYSFKWGKMEDNRSYTFKCNHRQGERQLKIKRRTLINPKDDHDPMELIFKGKKNLS